MFLAELELSGPTDVKSATARASVEGASQGPLKNGQSQPAVDCKSLEVCNFQYQSHQRFFLV